MDKPNSERKRFSYVKKKPTKALQRLVTYEVLNKLKIAPGLEHSVIVLPVDFKDWVSRIFELTDLDFDGMTCNEIINYILLSVFNKIGRAS